MYKSKIVLALISMVLLTAAVTLLSANEKSKYQTLNHTNTRNPIDSGEYFIGYKLCNTCHGYDSSHLANIDALGNDVNIIDDWRTTMMANSARDPLFHAKVSHEITVNPGHSLELQTSCLDCHAPMGRFTALFHGASFYTLDDMFNNDTLGIEGVSCMSCHTIGTEGLGSRFSGDIPYDTTKKIFGPFTNPFAGPMQLYVGMTPTYSDHMINSPICASCHTLITNTADLSGNLTGGTFVEQATYHEYINSIYNSQQIYCQTCHMPQLEEPIVIANQILALIGRSPFNLHQFAGANEFMLKLMKANKNYLGIDAADSYFDSTILYTTNNLTKNSVTLTLAQDSLHIDTAYFSLNLTNKAGHKFPSGYPSRRAVVQFVVLKDNGDTLFRSGTFSSSYEVNYLSGPYEEHHDIINQQAQSQIYEMVMGDVIGNKTTVLERAAIVLKDNRLVPNGFTTSHFAYDTAKIDNIALADDDFNKTTAGAEGTGKDIVHFHIPTNGYSGLINVYAKIYYQSVPPGWLQEMFSYSTAFIDTFRNMYQAADKTPVLCASDELLNVQLLNGIDENNSSGKVSVYPSLAFDGLINIRAEKVSAFEIYSSDGKLMKRESGLNTDFISNIKLPYESGIYFVKVFSLTGIHIYKIYLN